MSGNPHILTGGAMMKLSDRELATVLAALRYYQSDIRDDGMRFEFGDIATDGMKFKPMGADEIDTLCERLNVTPAINRVLITIEGGLIQNISADDERGLDCVTVDFDTEGASPGDYCFQKLSDGSSAFVSARDVDKADETTRKVMAEVFKLATE